MAGSFRRAMQYLGLVDDEADEYYDDEYYDEGARVPAEAYGRPAPESRGNPAASPQVQSVSESGAVSVVRPVRDSGDSTRSGTGPVVLRAAAARVYVMEPRGFNDAQEVGDRLRENQPVILNLQNVDRDLQRRLIDFSSGLAYALGGTMSKAADHVFLLTPSNVSVSEEEKDRLEAEGLYRR